MSYNQQKKQFEQSKKQEFQYKFQSKFSNKTIIITSLKELEHFIRKQREEAHKSATQILIYGLPRQQKYECNNQILNFCRLNLTSLIDITFNNIKITIQGFQNFKRFSSLKKIIINRSEIDKNTLEQLFFNFQKLEQLSLSSNSIQSIGIKKISQNKWINLIYLSLQNNLVGNNGLNLLIKCEWPKLEQINLSQNLITSDGIKLLVRSRWFELKKIKLYGNFIQDQGLAYFLSLNQFKKLTYVRITANPLSLIGIKYALKGHIKNVYLCYYQIGIENFIQCSKLSKIIQQTNMIRHFQIC